jgi:hypothetical protein
MRAVIGRSLWEISDAAHAAARPAVFATVNSMTEPVVMAPLTSALGALQQVLGD